MNRLIILAVVLCLCGFGRAQEQPKADPKPEAKKVEPKKDVPKPDEKVGGKGEEEEVDVAKTAERIAENAQKAGDRLKDKDPGEDTRNLQKEIIKDIDALLKKAKQPPPPSPDMMPPPMNDMPPPKDGMPPPKDGSGMPPPKSPMPMGSGTGMPPPKGGGNSKPERRPRRERKPQGESPMPMGKGEPMAKGGMEPMPAGPEPKDDPKGKGDKPAGGNLSPKRQNDKLADLYKDVWGDLPARMRQEMDLYYREQFMPRYSELLRQYYASLAEQRKKGTDR